MERHQAAATPYDLLMRPDGQSVSVMVAPFTGGRTGLRQAWTSVKGFCWPMRSRPVVNALSQPDATGVAELAARRQAITALAAEREVLDRRIARFLQADAVGMRRLARLPLLVRSVDAWWQRLGAERRRLVEALTALDQSRHGSRRRRLHWQRELLAAYGDVIALAVPLGNAVICAAMAAADAEAFRFPDGGRVPVTSYLQMRYDMLELARIVMADVGADRPHLHAWLQAQPAAVADGLIQDLSALVHATEGIDLAARGLRVAVKAHHRRAAERRCCLAELDETLQDMRRQSLPILSHELATLGIPLAIALPDRELTWLQARFRLAGQRLAASGGTPALVGAMAALGEWIGGVAERRGPELFVGVEAIRLGAAIDAVYDDLFCGRSERSAFDALLMDLAATVTTNPQTLRWLLRRSRAVAGLLPPARSRIPMVG